MYAITVLHNMLSNVQRGCKGGGAGLISASVLDCYCGWGFMELHTQQQRGNALLKANVEASLVSADMSDRLRLVPQFSGPFSLETDSEDPNLFILPPLPGPGSAAGFFLVIREDFIPTVPSDRRGVIVGSTLQYEAP